MIHQRGFDTGGAARRPRHAAEGHARILDPAVPHAQTVGAGHAGDVLVAPLMSQKNTSCGHSTGIEMASITSSGARAVLR